MIASLFPGQGSLVAGVGVPWADHPAWALVGEVSEIAEVDLAALLTAGTEEDVALTRNAQLGGLALGLVVHRAVADAGVRFQLSAGHSLGEYTALGAAGVLSTRGVTELVAVRGREMSTACQAEAGTMAAVMGLTASVAEEVCADLRRQGGRVWVANRNSSMQVALSGANADVAAAVAECREQGAKKVIELSVEGAFHTPLMDSAEAALGRGLADAVWHDTDLVMASNVEGRLVEDSSEWADLLRRQLCSPVRWENAIGALARAGAKAFVELGPGTTLSGLVKRIQRGRKAISVQTPDDISLAVDLFEQSTASSPDKSV